MSIASTHEWSAAAAAAKISASGVNVATGWRSALDLYNLGLSLQSADLFFFQKSVSGGMPAANTEGETKIGRGLPSEMASARCVFRDLRGRQKTSASAVGMLLRSLEKKTTLLQLDAAAACLVRVVSNGAPRPSRPPPTPLDDLRSVAAWGPRGGH